MTTGKKCAIATSLLVAMALSFNPAWGQWSGEYYANSHILPEDTSGWTRQNNGGAALQSALVGDTLWVNTMPPGNPDHSLIWQNNSGNFNFATLFVMEARLKLVASTSLYPRWGGAHLFSRSVAGYNITIDVDPGEVILGSIFNYVSVPMNTTDAFHTYRVVAQNNIATLYVDDVVSVGLALETDNPVTGFLFGDQGWEGGESYFEFVRYGVPEPGSAMLLAGCVTISLLGRRRRAW